MPADVVDRSTFDRYRETASQSRRRNLVIKSAAFLAIGFALALVVDNFTGVSRVARGYIGG